MFYAICWKIKIIVKEKKETKIKIIDDKIYSVFFNQYKFNLINDRQYLIRKLHKFSNNRYNQNIQHTRSYLRHLAFLQNDPCSLFLDIPDRYHSQQQFLDSNHSHFPT